jgi:hypothetical protein
MPSDFAFRLSTYLTLGLSCLCLGYSEWDLLPEAAVFAALVLVLLGVSFWAGRGYELSLESANRVGLVIGVLAAGWLAYQFINKNSLIYTLPWPASLLPYLGPLLMVLMPAKLFRPKHVGDWWAMQGIALAGVGLASSMAEDEVFAALLGLYAVAAVTSLTLFFYRRSAGALPAVPHTDPGPTPKLVAAGNGRVFLRSVGWLAAGVALGLPLFFLTPRSQAPKWQYGKSREVGLTTEQMVDLTRAGDLKVNREAAYQVRASYPDGRRKDDLNLNQRWRAVTLNQYDNGRWTRSDGGVILAGQTKLGQLSNPGRAQYVPPDFGPDGYQLDFIPRQSAAEPILADPVAWEVGKPPPVCTVTGNEPRQWFQTTDGAFRPFGTSSRGTLRYRQYTGPIPAPDGSASDPDLGPPFELASPPGSVPVPLAQLAANPTGPLAIYRTMRLPRLTDWTRALLERLAAMDPSVRTALDRADTRLDLRIIPDDYEPVARALSAHLAGSGEYKYTTKLRREDPAMDPVEEFLYRSKEGHCQRFAAALALVLRSVGVPANYVLGFKGCEPEGDGVYLVRQERAHAWVEVLVVRPAPPGFPFQRPDPQVCHWLSLDPTPDEGGDEAGGAIGGWFGAARETWLAFFQDFIVGYNQDRRDQAVATAERWLVRGGWVVVGVLALVAGVMAFRPGWRHRNGRAGSAPWATGYYWFDRLTEALAAGGYPVPPGATPREYAVATAAALAARPQTAAVAEVPPAVTRAFYLARYAGRPPAAAELARFGDDLARLRAALRSDPRPTNGAEVPA